MSDLRKVAAFTINGKAIDSDSPVYIIAELSANHAGRLQSALDLVKAAADSGADAIKLQTYTADTLTLNSKKPDFQLAEGNPWAGHRTLYELYQSASTPWEWHEALFEEAERNNLGFLSSPFDSTAVEFLESLKCPAYKIASPEIFDVGLIKAVTLTGKPIILSTGMASLDDVDLAVDTIEKNGGSTYAILKCTSAYPTPLSALNLSSMPMLQQRYRCLVGLSDHSMGNTASIVATTLGAGIIEKHLCLQSSDETLDSFFSLTPSEFKNMVQAVRDSTMILGRESIEIADDAELNLQGARSLYISAQINRGEVFTRDNIRSVRPGYGLHPKYFDAIIGKKASKNLEYGDRLTWDCVE